MAEHRYDEMLNRARESLDYWAEEAIVDFTEEIVRLMGEKGISRADLARNIGSSQAYITKVLGGNANFTITTMTKLARALDAVVRIHLAPEGAIVHWDDETETPDTKTDVEITDCSDLQIEVRAFNTDTSETHSVAA